MAVGAVLAGCGGGSAESSDPGSTTTTTAALPAACAGPPLTLDLRAGGDHEAGGEDFEVSRAVALRTPILPGEMAFDGAGLAALQSKAEITPLAVYTLYLSDFAIDEEELTGRGLGYITPPAGKTIGLLSLVPATEAGLAEGDVVLPGELGYDTNTTFAPLTLQVIADGDSQTMAYTDIEGQAKVLVLDDDELCVDFDVTLTNQDEVVYEGKGTVLAPVVRSEPAFFFT